MIGKILKMDVIFFIIVGASVLIIASADPTTKNVLFLAADDMRPDLGVYSRNGMTGPRMYTPNHSNCLVEL